MKLTFDLSGKKKDSSWRIPKKKANIVAVCVIAAVAVIVLLIHFLGLGRDWSKVSEAGTTWNYVENESGKEKETKNPSFLRITNMFDFGVRPTHDYDSESAKKLITEYTQIDDEMATVLENYDKMGSYVISNIANYPNTVTMFLHYNKNNTPPSDIEMSEYFLTEDCPTLYQYDERWAYEPVGNGIVGFEGSAPTALSIVCVGLAKNTGATPNRFAILANNSAYINSFFEYQDEFFTDTVGSYGLSAQEITPSEDEMKRQIDAGNFLILRMGRGMFALKETYIVVYAFDSGGFYIRDPRSFAKTNKKWTYNELSKEILKCWAYSKTESESETK